MAQKIITDRVKEMASLLIEKHGKQGTYPLFLFDLDVSIEISNNFYKKAKEIFNNVEIAYSYKSNNLSMLCQMLNKRGFSAEVASKDEIELALIDGFKSTNIIFDGPLKHDDELLFSINNGIRIQIDTIDEAFRIEAICKKINKQCKIYIRLTHYYDHNLSRFGLTELEFLNLYNNLLTKSKFIEFLGFHIHVGSNLETNEKLISTLNRYSHLLKKYMPDNAHLDLGSGFPADSFSDNQDIATPDPLVFFKNIRTNLEKTVGHKYKNWHFIFEPGRCFTEDHGYFIGRVISSKMRNNIEILQTNLGINWIPSIRGWHHIISSLNKEESINKREQLLSGFNCFESDYLFNHPLNIYLELGDYFIVRGCGAYDLQTANAWTRKKIGIYSIYNNELKCSRIPQKIKHFRPYDLLIHSYKIDVDTEIVLYPPDGRFHHDLFSLIQKNKACFSEFMEWPKYVLTINDTINFLNECALSHQQEKSKTYIIFFREKLVGVLSFNKIDSGNKVAEIGYWLDSDHHGKGIMTKSLTALIRHYSNQGMIRRFVIKCITSNTNSNKLAQRCGFLHEGVLKKAEFINNNFYDQNIYAKTL